ncbi:MAG: hypothetical protein GX318_05660 [Clostridia bacterium]|nr:hypothetical protein [Clostridia bacterium]
MLNAISTIGYFFLLGYTIFLLKKHRKEFLTREQSESRGKWIAYAGLLAALAVILQSSPVFLPVVGLALSPLSSLPVIIGTLLFADRVLPMFLAAAALLFLVNVQEAVIFLLTTGPLGLTAALAVIPTIPFWRKSLVTTSLLTCGILLLTFLVGLPGLQNTVGSLNMPILLAIIAFSFLYSSLFMRIAIYSQNRMPAKLVHSYDEET